MFPAVKEIYNLMICYKKKVKFSNLTQNVKSHIKANILQWFSTFY